jgi:4-hydroxybenzoate polyprenyltransferase
MNYKTIRAIIISLRPKQWSKNLFLFAGILFSQQISEQPLLLKVTFAFFLFCLLTGGAYLVNDVIDKESDSKNPLKNRRPVASDQLSVRAALICAITLFAVSISVSFACDTSLGFITLLYLATQILYSLWLKRVVILDIFTIVFSYLLRAHSSLR